MAKEMICGNCIWWSVADKYKYLPCRAPTPMWVDDPPMYRFDASNEARNCECYEEI